MRLGKFLGLESLPVALQTGTSVNYQCNQCKQYVPGFLTILISNFQSPCQAIPSVS